MPDQWRRDHPAAYTALTMLISLPIVLCALFIFDKASSGDDARKAVDRLAASQERSECVTSYSAADRVASGNLDIRKAKVIELFAQAVVAGDTEALARDFDDAQAALDEAIEDRVAIGLLQGDVNRLCDPDRTGGPVPAPTVDPLEEAP